MLTSELDFIRINEEIKESYSYFTKTLRYGSTQDEKKVTDRYCDIANICILRQELEVGDHHSALGRYERALEIYSELDVKASREVPIMLQYQWKINSGTCLARLGRKEEALIIYRELLDLIPNSIKTLSNIAILLAELGRYEESISTFSKCPESYNTLSGMAACLRALHYYTESEGLAAKAALFKNENIMNNLYNVHHQEPSDLLSTPTPSSLSRSSKPEKHSFNVRRIESQFSSSPSPGAKEGKESKYFHGNKDSDQKVTQSSHRVTSRHAPLDTQYPEEQRHTLIKSTSEKEKKVSSTMICDNREVMNNQHESCLGKKIKVFRTVTPCPIITPFSSPLSVELPNQFVISPLSNSMIVNKADHKRIPDKNPFPESLNLPKKDLISKIMRKTGSKCKENGDQMNCKNSLLSITTYRKSPIISPLSSTTGPCQSSFLQWPTPLYRPFTPNSKSESYLSFPSTSTPAMGSRRSSPFQSPSTLYAPVISCAKSLNHHQVPIYTPSKASPPKLPYYSGKLHRNQVGNTESSSPSPFPQLAQSNMRWNGNPSHEKNRSTITTSSTSKDSNLSASMYTMDNKSGITDFTIASTSLPVGETIAIRPSKISHAKTIVNGSISSSSSVLSSSVSIYGGTSMDGTESMESWSGKPMRYHKPLSRGKKNDLEISIAPFYPKEISRKHIDIIKLRHGKSREKGIISNASLDLTSSNIGS